MLFCMLHVSIYIHLNACDFDWYRMVQELCAFCLNDTSLMDVVLYVLNGFFIKNLIIDINK